MERLRSRWTPCLWVGNYCFKIWLLWDGPRANAGEIDENEQAGRIYKGCKQKVTNKRENMSTHYLHTLAQGQKSHALRAYGESVYDLVAHMVGRAGEIKEVL
jgi:hypothetical protein